LQEYAALQQRALEISHQLNQLEQEKKEVYTRLAVYQGIVDSGYEILPKVTSKPDFESN
jgi:hypothetical protein